MNTRLLSIVAACICCVAAQKFDRNYVGVTFSPYTDYQPARNWDQYSLEDIMMKLQKIRSYFSEISTYGMGTQGHNRGRSWDQCESSALVARAAAVLNQRSSTKMKVNIGVYQMPNEQQREIDNAFAAAGDANNRAGGTVWGITFTNEYIHNRDQASEVLSMIRNNKGRARNMGLKVGTRTEVCGVYTDPNNGFRGVMNDIARESDYIYCNLYPSREHAAMGPTRAAQEVMNYYFYVRSEIRKVNPNLEVLIGETGWPSMDNSFNNSENNDQNLVAYWKAINSLASQNRVKVQMFEALNEPWKGPNSREGYYAESHYGWWYKRGNNDDCLVEKETGRCF